MKLRQPTAGAAVILVVLLTLLLLAGAGLSVAVIDARPATARAADLAPTYGGDAARLAVLGHSAGAYLALMIALDARYMKAAGRPDVIRAAAGLAGPYDFLPFDVASTRDAFGAAPDPVQTQPVTFAGPNAPPAFLASGEADLACRITHIPKAHLGR